MKTTFQDRLRSILDGHGKVPALSKMCGISQSTLRSYIGSDGKSGKASIPNLNNVIDIASAAGVNFLWLATGEGEMSGDTSYSSVCIDDVLAAMKHLEEWLAIRRGTMDPDIKVYAVKLLYESWATKEKYNDETPDRDLEKVLEKLMNR